MAHHRCSRCKQESYPRHKWMWFLFCDRCLRAVSGRAPRYGIFSFFGRMWDFFHYLGEAIFKRREEPEKKRERQERRIHHRLKVMEAKARGVRPLIFHPQMH